VFAGLFVCLFVCHSENESPPPSISAAQVAASFPQHPVSSENTEHFESAAVSSDVSATATADECVSEGQWLVNVLSEGEVPDLEANECKQLAILTVLLLVLLLIFLAVVVGSDSVAADFLCCKLNSAKRCLF